MKTFGKKALITILATLLSASSLFAKPDIKNAYIVSSVNDGIATSQPKNAKLDDKVDLYCAIKAEEDGKTVYYTNAEKLSIDGKLIGNDSIKKWDEKNGKIGVNWFKVESEGANYYNGNVIGKNGKTEWQWAKIKYVETPVEEWNGKFECSADVKPNTVPDRNEGTGTMRFKVKVKYDNKSVESPGKESVYSGERGITNKVHRVSIRKDDSYIGWMHSWINLPYIWGSDKITKDEKSHQSDLFIGADCADLVVAAKRAMGKNIPYFASHGFKKNGIYMKYADYIVDNATLGTDGFFYDGDKKIKISSGKNDAKIGDIIYFGGHVGTLSEDKEPKGILDKNDLYINTLFDVPKEESFENGYSPSFSILRWKEK